ncbi:hypothetical protein VB779_09470 [Haloarculaceae archaeon H-GB11]|nr:hypothetical protein [Haloarculaceae archaeon H-GB11]
MPEVDGFGTLHLDRPAKVRAELTEFSDGVSIFFVEGPRNQPNKADLRRLILRNPIMWVTDWILYVVWGVPGLLLTKKWGPVDGSITESVSQEEDIEIEPVDLNLVRRASDVSIWVSIFSWFMLLLSIALVFLSVLWGSWNLTVLAMVVGFLPVVPFAFGTLSERDAEMAKNIDEILSNRDDVQRTCIIAGRRHIDGVVDELEKGMCV